LGYEKLESIRHPSPNQETYTMTRFISKNFKKSFKTLALLGIVLQLTAAIPAALAVETFEEVEKMTREAFSAPESYSKKQLYDGVQEKFLAFWHEHGAKSYSCFQDPPSRSSLEASVSELEAFKGSIPSVLVSSKEVFAQWEERLFQEQTRLIKQEFPFDEWSSYLQTLYQRSALRMIDLQKKGKLIFKINKKDKWLVIDDPGDEYSSEIRMEYSCEFLERYLSVVERAEEASLNDPAYVPLRELWKACQSSESTTERVANQIESIERVGSFESAQIVLEALMTDKIEDPYARVLKETQKKHDQLVEKRRDFVLDVWSAGNFGIGKELLNMLRDACDGGKTEALEERPFVKYAEVLPEAFVAHVMEPFSREVLAPAMELAQTTP